MADIYRWSRTFREEATFSHDLGSVGAWVGPRAGPARRTQDQKEDYVLRRLLIAWRRCGRLRFPFMVHASAQAPRQPDFLLEDAEGGWGLEVTEAGSKPHQQRMTAMAREPGEPYLVSDDGWSPASIVSQLRTAIESKVCKFDGGWYGPRCELAVFNNTEDVLSDEIVAAGRQREPQRAVRGRPPGGQRRQARVYADILSDAPKRIDIAADYDVDFADWIADQVELLRASQWSRLDVDNLIEEVAALARARRQGVGEPPEGPVCASAEVGIPTSRP